jgi:hypothetical protein
MAICTISGAPLIMAGMRSSRWRAVDHEGDDGQTAPVWISVAFASDGIRSFGRYNKINDLRPREGSTAVPFPPPFSPFSVMQSDARHSIFILVSVL